MPFSTTTEAHTSEYWTRHYDEFLKPLIEEAPSVVAQRSRELRSDILKGIVTQLVTSDVVVADLTDHNPNVMWELGVRVAFRHGTITVAEKDTLLPFDVTTKGTLFYPTKDHIGMEKFRREFKEAVVDCLQNPAKTDSFVLETLSGRGTIYELLRRDEAGRRVGALEVEHRHNIATVDHVTSMLNKNTETKTRNSPHQRFRSVCLELLITTRYVDADPTFYSAAEVYHADSIQMNHQLAALEYSPASFEATSKFLLETALKVYRERAMGFAKRFEAVKTKFD